MKKIDTLLKRIDGFLALSEKLLRQAALNVELGKGMIPEHLLLQAMERATDDEGKPSPQRGKEAYQQLVDFMTRLTRERDYFSKIPMDSKWTIEFPRAHLKAIVEKIYEAGHPVLILKTFLKPDMYETGSQGLLSEFLKSIKSEKEFGGIRDKLKESRKVLKTLDRLLTKKFPIPAEELKKSPPEVQKIMVPVFLTNKNKPLTEEFVRAYKLKLETEIQKLLQQLPPKPESESGME